MGPLGMRRGWVVVVAGAARRLLEPGSDDRRASRARHVPDGVASLLSPPPTAALPRPDRVRQEPWMRSLDRLIGDRPVSVSVMARGVRIYGHLPKVPRTPASNEKLLLSMVMLDRFGADYRIATEAAGSGRVRDGVLGATSCSSVTATRSSARRTCVCSRCACRAGLPA
jgi:hypothetical protein